MKWATDDIDGYLNFYSVSGDGRVSNWTIVKSSMWCTDALNITFAKQLKHHSEETAKVLSGNYFILIDQYLKNLPHQLIICTS